MDLVFNREVRPLLDLVDTLREIGIQNEISLPQICVMGDQSSGKSSVLESISGIPFPRGSGLVTRCPTELIMSKSPAGSSWRGEISVSWNQPQPEACGKLNSISELTGKISHLADVLTNNQANGFSTNSIVIKISSPESPDLTLIDLPGIVRTSTSGQDSGVIKQVNDLIERYIAMPNTIILAVVPCNQDIATVDILERAARVDPAGLRTIGVLTKPDLIGPGAEEEVVQVLLNIRKPLQLGYIMCKNISQKQQNEGMTLAQAKAEEMVYFNNHPHFSAHIAKNLFGVNNLIYQLTKLLVACIKRSIPVMIQDIKSLLAKAHDDLSALGTEMPLESREQQSLLVRKISTYCQLLRHSSRGEYRDADGVLASSPDVRLHTQVQDVFKELQSNVLGLRPITNSSINTELLERLEYDMQTQKGREMPGFINTQVFYAHIIELVEAWRPIVDECKSTVIANTLSVSNAISAEVIKEFPELCSAIQSMTAHLIEETHDDVALKLDALIAKEQDPFTTQDVLLEVVNGIRFRTFDHILRQGLDGIDVKAMGDNKDAFREEVRKKLGNWYMVRHGVDSKGNQHEMITLIQAYWDIASRRLIDNVCMCIEMEFTARLITALESKCVLYGIALDAGDIKRLMQEDPSIGEQRKYLKEKIAMLSASLSVLRKATHDQQYNVTSA